MAIEELTLAISRRPYPERDRVVDAWISQGGEIVEIDRFWQPPDLNSRTTKIYGNSHFSKVLASKIGLQLATPSNELLTHLDFYSCVV